MEPQRVRVVARIRPLMPHEGQESCVRIETRNDASDTQSEPCVVLQDPRFRAADCHRYAFDSISDSTVDQETFFRQNVESAVAAVFEGMNTSIFAYGITGSGKTHTMQGMAADPKQHGVIPRAMQLIFEKLAPGQHIYASYLEIYKERVYDLLEPKDTDLAIREDYHRQIFVDKLAQVYLPNFISFVQVYDRALKARKTFETRCNAVSSRSHAILQIFVRGKPRTGKLHLIDLAGSEDNRKTGNKGERLQESTNINVSLFTLGKVIHALNDGDSRVPYRDSKLTRLLQDSLGGSSRAIMIANISPSVQTFLDTYHTLNYASKSRQIVNKPAQRQESNNHNNELCESFDDECSEDDTDFLGKCCGTDGGGDSDRRKRMLALWRNKRDIGASASFMRPTVASSAAATLTAATSATTMTIATSASAAAAAAGSASSCTATSRLVGQKRSRLGSDGVESSTAPGQANVLAAATAVPAVSASRVAQLEMKVAQLQALIQQQQQQQQPQPQNKQQLAMDPAPGLSTAKTQRRLVSATAGSLSTGAATVRGAQARSERLADDRSSCCDQVKDDIAAMTPTTTMRTAMTFVENGKRAKQYGRLQEALKWYRRALGLLPHYDKIACRVSELEKAIGVAATATAATATAASTVASAIGGGASVLQGGKAKPKSAKRIELADDEGIEEDRDGNHDDGDSDDDDDDDEYRCEDGDLADSQEDDRLFEESLKAESARAQRQRRSKRRRTGSDVQRCDSSGRNSTGSAGSSNSESFQEGRENIAWFCNEDHTLSNFQSNADCEEPGALHPEMALAEGGRCWAALSSEEQQRGATRLFERLRQCQDAKDVMKLKLKSIAKARAERIMANIRESGESFTRLEDFIRVGIFGAKQMQKFLDENLATLLVL